MTEALTTTMGSNPILRIMTHHLFAGYGQEDGEPVAIVDSTAPISAALDIPSSPLSSGAPTHVVETGTIIVHTLFGLDIGQPADDQTDENLRLAISQPDAEGKTATVAVRLMVAASMRLSGP